MSEANEPDSNVELANRFVCEMEREAKKAASNYEDVIDWMTRKGMVTELAFMRDVADEAEKLLAEAYDLRAMVLNGDCTCPPDGNACEYCQALNAIRVSIGVIEEVKFRRNAVRNDR
jgi:hypothetical protein